MRLGPGVLAALLVVAAPAAHAAESAFARGVRLYEDADHLAALDAFTRALDRTKQRRELAQIHVYIGLIQVHFDQGADAARSFNKALVYDLNVRLPSGAPDQAKKLFSKLRKEARKRSAPASAPIAEDPPDDGAPEKAAAPVDDDVARPPAASEINVAPSAAATSSAAGPPLVVESPGPALPTVGGWIGLGIGVVAVSTGIAFTALAQSTNARALEEDVAQESFKLHEEAVDQQFVSYVSFGAGAAALGVGLYLLLGE